MNEQFKEQLKAELNPPAPPETPAPEPTKRFYKKELLSNRLSLPNGKTVRFEPLGGSDTGVLVTSDLNLIAELGKAAGAGIGGVVELDEAAYEQLKKNPPQGRRSQLNSLTADSVRQVLRAGRSNPQGNAPVAVEPPPHQPSAPMEVPKGLAKVSTRAQLKALQKMAEQPALVPA